MTAKTQALTTKSISVFIIYYNSRVVFIHDFLTYKLYFFFKKFNIKATNIIKTSGAVKNNSVIIPSIPYFFKKSLLKLNLLAVAKVNVTQIFKYHTRFFGITEFFYKTILQRTFFKKKYRLYYFKKYMSNVLFKQSLLRGAPRYILNRQLKFRKRFFKNARVLKEQIKYLKQNNLLLINPLDLKSGALTTTNVLLSVKKKNNTLKNKIQKFTNKKALLNNYLFLCKNAINMQAVVHTKNILKQKVLTQKHIKAVFLKKKIKNFKNLNALYSSSNYKIDLRRLHLSIHNTVQKLNLLKKKHLINQCHRTSQHKNNFTNNILFTFKKLIINTFINNNSKSKKNFYIKKKYNFNFWAGFFYKMRTFKNLKFIKYPWFLQKRLGAKLSKKADSKTNKVTTNILWEMGLLFNILPSASIIKKKHNISSSYNKLHLLLWKIKNIKNNTKFITRFYAKKIYKQSKINRRALRTDKKLILFKKQLKLVNYKFFAGALLTENFNNLKTVNTWQSNNFMHTMFNVIFKSIQSKNYLLGFFNKTMDVSLYKNVQNLSLQYKRYLFTSTMFCSYGDYMITMFLGRLQGLVVASKLKNNTANFKTIVNDRKKIKHSTFSISTKTFAELFGAYAVFYKGDRLKQIKFKPGYYRFFRRLRTDFEQSRNLKYRYQWKLTYYLARLNKMSNTLLIGSFDLELSNFLIRARFFTTVETAKNAILKGHVYILGKLCRAPTIQVQCHDVISLVCTYTTYNFIKIEWLRAFKTLFVWFWKVRKETMYNNVYKSKHNLYRKTKFLADKAYKSFEFDPRLKQAYTATLDVPSYIECCYLTLTACIIFMPYRVNDLSKISYRASAVWHIRMLNWKYLS